MAYTIVGLGNPKEEHEHNRHNAGRMSVSSFAEAFEFPEWKEDKANKLLKSQEKIEKEKVILVMPDNFMNNSGQNLKSLVKTVKAAEKLVVVYDDLDMPLGNVKISFARGSGGHKGVESIIKNLKTKNFIRVRIGISPSTPKGIVKKLTGEDKVHKFILGDFRSNEKTILKAVFKKTDQILDTIIREGKEVAMNQYN